MNVVIVDLDNGFQMPYTRLIGLRSLGMLHSYRNTKFATSPVHLNDVWISFAEIATVYLLFSLAHQRRICLESTPDLLYAASAMVQLRAVHMTKSVKTKFFWAYNFKNGLVLVVSRTCMQPQHTHLNTWFSWASSHEPCSSLHLRESKFK